MARKHLRAIPAPSSAELLAQGLLCPTQSIGGNVDWTTITQLERQGGLPDEVGSPVDVRKLLHLYRPPAQGPKILYLDIECTPNIADVWGMYDQNVGLSQLKQASRIMGFAYCWNHGMAARWVGENKTSRHSMLAAAHLLYDEADIVVTYNGNSYDHKVLNAEWVKEKFLPPAPYKSLDLYSVVSKNFRFPTKKLAYVAQQLIGDTKVSHSGHDLWNACLDPHIDEKTRTAAWRVMSRYCRQDVDLLVPLHEVLLPWLTDSANIAFLNQQDGGCPKCGGKLVRRGFYHTPTRKYQRYCCTGCGGWTRGTKCLETFPQRDAA